MTAGEIIQEIWEQKRHIAIETHGKSMGTRVYMGENELDIIVNHIKDKFAVFKPNHDTLEGRDQIMGLDIYIVLDTEPHIKVVQ